MSENESQPNPEESKPNTQQSESENRTRSQTKGLSIITQRVVIMISFIFSGIFAILFILQIIPTFCEDNPGFGVFGRIICEDWSTRDNAVGSLSAGFEIPIRYSRDSQPFTVGTRADAQGFEIEILEQIVEPYLRDEADLPPDAEIFVYTDRAVGDRTPRSIGAISYTDDRCINPQFPTICTEPHFVDTLGVTARNGIAVPANQFDSFSAFCDFFNDNNDLRIAFVSGTRAIGVFDDCSNIPVFTQNPIEFTTRAEAVRSVSQEPSDAPRSTDVYITDYVILQHYSSNVPNLTLTRVPGTNEEYIVLLNQTDAGLQELINEALRTPQGGPIYQRLFNQTFQSGTYNPPPDMPLRFQP